ncbi:MAG: DPP IV N-terminal domain-containing protein, partial [Candidatus Poribacteria bacterium]
MNAAARSTAIWFAALAALAGCGEDVETFPSGLPPVADPTQIAFVSDRDGYTRIYLMDEDGSNQRPLSDPAHGSDTYPSWSPNGRHIAFVSYRDHPEYGEIYVMDADGENERNITNSPLSHDTHPSWSPDGGTIAFASDRDYGPRTLDVYSMGVDGSDVRRLMGSEDGHTAWPVWTPDGAYITYLGPPRDGTPANNNWSIYVMGGDAGNPVFAGGVRAPEPRRP